MKGKLDSLACIAMIFLIAMSPACKNEGDAHTAGHEQHTDTMYTCPMHPDVISSQPGRCPKCNMNLEPIFNDTLRQISHTNHASSHHPDTLYTCPMHPDVVSSQPGQCPKCNMNLVPVVNDTLVQIISPNKQVLSRQGTITLQSGSNQNTIQAQGFVDVDQTRNQSVSARFGGRIEKLYVKFNLQYVRQGAKIMDLYSPVLRTIQEQHLFLLRSEANHVLAERSREKLRLLGITDIQITQLETSGTIASTVSVFSPSNGYVFFTAPALNEDKSSVASPGVNNMQMQQDVTNESTFGSSASQIREGMYINEGQVLFSVNDLQQVWALVSIPNAYLGQIREHQIAEIIPENDTSKKETAKISILEQIFEEKNQRFARARIVLPNRENVFKINALITARIRLGGNSNLQVPNSAVYRTGMNAYVWVKMGTTKQGAGIFKLRKVIAQDGSNGMTTIINGLALEEEIAKEAGLMVDSETFLTDN